MECEERGKRFMNKIGGSEKVAVGEGEEVHYNNKQDRGSEKIGVGEEVYIL